MIRTSDGERCVQSSRNENIIENAQEKKTFLGLKDSPRFLSKTSRIGEDIFGDMFLCCLFWSKIPLFEKILTFLKKKLNPFLVQQHISWGLKKKVIYRIYSVGKNDQNSMENAKKTCVFGKIWFPRAILTFLKN